MSTVSSDTETPSPTPERIRRIRRKCGLPRPLHAHKKVSSIKGVPPKGSVKDAICATLEARAGQKRNDFRPKVGAAERRDRTHGEKFVAASEDKYGTGNVYVNLGPATGARERALDRERIERRHKRHFFDTDAMGSEQECNVYLQ